MRQKKWFDYKRIGVKVDENIAKTYQSQLNKEGMTAQEDLHDYIINRTAIMLVSDSDNREKNLKNVKVPAIIRKRMRSIKIK